MRDSNRKHFEIVNVHFTEFDSILFIVNLNLYISRVCTVHSTNKPFWESRKKSLYMHECIDDFTNSNGKINFDMKYSTNVCYYYENMHACFPIFDINNRLRYPSLNHGKRIDSALKFIWRCINLHCLRFQTCSRYDVNPFTTAKYYEWYESVRIFS